MQKSLAKLSIFCENAKGFDLFCLFLLINQEKLGKYLLLFHYLPVFQSPTLLGELQRQAGHFLLARNKSKFLDRPCT